MHSNLDLPPSDYHNRQQLRFIQRITPKPSSLRLPVYHYQPRSFRLLPSLWLFIAMTSFILCLNISSTNAQVTTAATSSNNSTIITTISIDNINNNNNVTDSSTSMTSNPVDPTDATSKTLKNGTATGSTTVVPVTTTSTSNSDPKEAKKSEYLSMLIEEPKEDFIIVRWNISDELEPFIDGFVVGYQIVEEEEENEDNDDDDKDGHKNDCVVKNTPQGQVISEVKSETSSGGCELHHTTTLEFSTAKLPKGVNSLRIHVPASQTILICVYAKAKDSSNLNATNSAKSCLEYTHVEPPEEDNSNRYITGLLASVVFLTPCLIVLVYIVYLDKKKMERLYGFTGNDDEKPLVVVAKEKVPRYSLTGSEIIISRTPSSLSSSEPAVIRVIGDGTLSGKGAGVGVGGVDNKSYVINDNEKNIHKKELDNNEVVKKKDASENLFKNAKKESLNDKNDEGTKRRDEKSKSAKAVDDGNKKSKIEEEKKHEYKNDDNEAGKFGSNYDYIDDNGDDDQMKTESTYASVKRKKGDNSTEIRYPIVDKELPPPNTSRYSYGGDSIDNNVYVDIEKVDAEWIERKKERERESDNDRKSSETEQVDVRL